MKRRNWSFYCVLVIELAKMKSKSTQSLNSSLLIDLEAAKEKIVGNSSSWKAIVKRKLLNFGPTNKYDDDVADLLLFIRNRMAHYSKDPILHKWEGELYIAVYQSFDGDFPNLLIEVYNVILQHCSTEQYFLKYLGL